MMNPVASATRPPSLPLAHARGRRELAWPGRTQQPPSSGRTPPLSGRDRQPTTRFVAARSTSSSLGNTPPPPPPPRRRATTDPSTSSSSDGDGTFILLAINLAVFLLARLTPLPVIPTLALVHSNPQAWQFVTCAFTHFDFGHLAGNLFSLLVFGRMVEEEEGAVGVVLTYLVCGAAAGLASFVALPAASISLGASGSVFGLFVVAVFAKIRPSPKKLLECGVLSVYVFAQISNEVKAQAAVSLGRGAAAVGSAGVVAHVAHIAGALAGVALVALLSRLPAAGDE